jgi:hypothetical protein
MEENQGFKPDPGNLAVRHYRGATGIVSHGGNVNPSCNRKSRNGNPPPKASAPVLYPDQGADRIYARQERDCCFSRDSQGRGEGRVDLNLPASNLRHDFSHAKEGP